MADENALTTFAAVAHHLHVHLGHQRAGGIEHLQATSLGFLAYRLGNPMGTEDDNHLIRHLIQLFHEHRATGTQVFDHELVMHHFVTHINGWPEYFQCAVDDLDGAIDAGTEATRVGEFDLHAGDLDKG